MSSPATSAASVDVIASHSAVAPARYFWLKRLLPLAILYVAALLAVRLWWGWEAQRRFDAAVARWRALGQPVFAEDFDREREPRRDPRDEALIAELAQLTKLSSKDDEWLGASGYTVETICRRPARFAEVHAQLEPARRRLQDLRHARAPVWGPTVEDFARHPGVEFQPNGLTQVLDAVSEAAVLSHALGDDAAAVAALDEALWVVRVVAGRTPCRRTSRGQAGASLSATEAAEEISPALRVEPPGARQRNVGTASRDAVKALIIGYLDDTVLTRALQDGPSVERTLAITAAASARVSLPQMGWLATPLDWLEVVRIGEPIATVAAAAAAGKAGQVRFSAGSWGGGSMTLRSAVHQSTGEWLSSLDWLRVLSLRAVARQRMAAVALAVRLYELDHGVRPATLDALVPEYIECVPDDPFAHDVRPIGYVIGDPYPRLYSVNIDGVDDGGLFLLRASGGVDRDVADLVFFLTRDYPRKPIFLPDHFPLP